MDPNHASKIPPTDCPLICHLSMQAEGIHNIHAIRKMYIQVGFALLKVSYLRISKKHSF